MTSKEKRARKIDGLITIERAKKEHKKIEIARREFKKSISRKYIKFLDSDNNLNYLRFIGKDGSRILARIHNKQNTLNRIISINPDGLMDGKKISDYLTQEEIKNFYNNNIN